MRLLSRRAAYNSLTFFTGAAAFYTYQNYNQHRKKMLPPYEATFSVPLKCESCVDDIKGALSKVEGISKTTFSLPSSLVTITSTAPPSTLITTIQSTGRDAILRGSGQPNSAAVCILEIPPPPSSSSASPSEKSNKPTKKDSPVRGLARLIQLSDTLTLLDVTLTALPPGKYRVSVRQKGDISAGSASLGPVYDGENNNCNGDGRSKRKGELGVLEIDGKGRGNLVGEVGWRVWELVGRGMCVERIHGGDDEGKEVNGEGKGRGQRVTEVVGVVARSAGVWENEKVVCGCSGKTVWEEREEMVGRGML